VKVLERDANIVNLLRRSKFVGAIAYIDGGMLRAGLNNETLSNYDRTL